MFYLYNITGGDQKRDDGDSGEAEGLRRRCLLDKA